MTTVARVGSVRLGRQRSPGRQTGRFPTKYLRAANITSNGLDLADILEMDFTPAERERFALQPGDIILAEASGSPSQVGRAALWDGEIPGCCYQNTVIRFRPHIALPAYSLIVFRHYAESGAFARAARGVGIQHLGASRFAAMPFPLPPMAEQGRIAVEVERRLAGLYNAETSLQSALQHVDGQNREIVAAAVSGALVEPEAAVAAREGRPFQDVRSLLVEIGSADEPQHVLFDEGSISDAAERSERSLPAGWTWARVGAVGELRPGRQRSPESERGEHPTPYLRVANITRDGLDLSDIREMNFDPAERRIYALWPGDVVVVESSGTPSQVGRAVLWRGEIPGCCYQNHIIRFRPRAALPEYALIVFRHYAESGTFARMVRGLGIQHLGVSRFARVPFPLPPLAEQERIVAEARRRLEASKTQGDVIRASLDRLPELRRELFAAAIGGFLAAQSEDDEPAEALLGRLPPPAAATDARPAVARTRETTVSRRRGPRRPEAVRPLSEVLRDAGRPVRLPELFALAGYDRDSTADIEQFYLALRAELGTTIQTVADGEENAFLEVVADAP